ncbi:glycosyltransferase family 2 protein [Desulfosporosinus sp. FKA]|uniref:glycosyltransferase family 2 protein n=1 Tax=Desulfosporosinus sp. FKA TaxID=1969834 RepID=UPI0015576F44|nr:glycosyltransferase family 2 protein [Desulfosporosinus sp. FKA]
MKTLTLAMIVKNESRCLARCLSSAADLVDEIIVVDTGSTDNTKDIATSFGAKIFDFTWVNDFSKARNFALNQSTSDWNLVLDADEYILNDCGEAIRKFIETQKAIGRVKLIDKFIQDGEEKLAQCYISRLIPKGIFYTGIIHEQVVSDFKRLNVAIELGHDGYISLNAKDDRNLKLLLLALERSPNDTYMLYQTATQYYLSKHYEMADKYFEKCYKLIGKSELYKPSMVVKYLYNIINTENFEKGLEIIHNERDALDNYPDYHFVCGYFYMELIYKDQKYENFFPLIEKEYCKCLEIGDHSYYDGVIGTGSFYALYNLGVLHEVTSNLSKAKEYYRRASDFGYEKATERLRLLESQVIS